MTPALSIGPAIAAPAAVPAASNTNPLAALIKMVADRFTVVPPLLGMRTAGDQHPPLRLIPMTEIYVPRPRR
jgi:hypothetical protein